MGNYRFSCCQKHDHIDLFERNSQLYQVFLWTLFHSWFYFNFKKMFIFIYRLLNIKSFLSHRYGQRMLPNEIELHKFQILKEECLKSCDLSFSLNLPNETSIEIENLLEHCYNLDENEIPKKYKLLNAYSIIPGFQLKVFDFL